MKILPTKYFAELQLTLPNIAMRCTDLTWNNQNRQATIRVDYFSSLDAAQIQGSQPIYTEYLRIDNYDSTLIEQLAENWLVTQDAFATAETIEEYQSRINPPNDQNLN